MMNGGPALSVVVPLYNECDNVLPLVHAVRAALGPEGGWELVLIDDGSADDTALRLREAAAQDPAVRLVLLAYNHGQTAALQAGLDAARGDVVVTMDGDLQNDPRDIPLLLEKMQEGYDLVAGYRVRRQDRFLTRKVPSYVANRIIGWITGVAIRDNGCALKAYRRELLDNIHLYSDMHRFIPAVAAATSAARICEIPVRHHARKHGESKYGLSRIWKVLADLLVISMIRTFRDRPLQMFGGAATASAALSLLFMVASIISLVTLEPTSVRAYVFPGSSLLLMGLAAYLLMLGMIAEGVLRQERSRGDSPLPVAREVRP
jgi:glycosyltransferase involved in cell wall biosynthesis